MARLWSGALTWQDGLADAYVIGSSALETTRVPLPGLVAERFNSYGSSQKVFTGALGTTYYAAMLFDVAAFNTGSFVDSRILEFVSCASVRLKDSGVVYLYNDGAGSQIGSNGPTLVAGNKVLVELAVKIQAGAGDDYAEARINGQSIASTTTGTINTVAPSGIYWGLSDALGTPGDVYISCLTLNNDAAGGDQTSWPGLQFHRVALPASDGTIGTNWQDGDAPGAASFEGINNVPPIGTAPGTAGHDNWLIGNYAGANTDTATFVTQTYAGLGIRPADRIVCIQQMIVTGSNTNTVTAGSMQVTANPALGADTIAAFWQSANVGTHPTGWGLTLGTLAYAPSVTRTTGATLLVGKTTSTTRDADVDAMGLIVSWRPALSIAQLQHRNTRARSPIAGRGQF